MSWFRLSVQFTVPLKITHNHDDIRNRNCKTIKYFIWGSKPTTTFQHPTNWLQCYVIRPQVVSVKPKIILKQLFPSFQRQVQIRLLFSRGSQWLLPGETSYNRVITTRQYIEWCEYFAMTNIPIFNKIYFQITRFAFI